MKAVVAAFNQEKALVGAFSVITNLRMQFGCNFLKHYTQAQQGATPPEEEPTKSHTHVCKCNIQPSDDVTPFRDKYF